MGVAPFLAGPRQDGFYRPSPGLARSTTQTPSHQSTSLANLFEPHSWMIMNCWLLIAQGWPMLIPMSIVVNADAEGAVLLVVAGDDDGARVRGVPERVGDGLPADDEAEVVLSGIVPLMPCFSRHDGQTSRAGMGDYSVEFVERVQPGTIAAPIII